MDDLCIAVASFLSSSCLLWDQCMQHTTSCGLCLADGQLTDMFSYYTLPSTVIGNPQYSSLKAAFMFYTVPGKTPLDKLMTDALIVANSKCALLPCALDACYSGYAFSAVPLQRRKHCLRLFITVVQGGSCLCVSFVIPSRREHDVFNALDILQNSSFLKPLKFGIGDGRLRYYLYNWRIKEELPPSDVGLILL